MSLEGRVKDALTSASQLVDPDERRALTAVRGRARRAAIIRRTANLVVTATFVVATIVLVPRVLDAASDTHEAPSSVPGGTTGEGQLVGSWTQAQSCRDFVRALTGYGLPDYVARFLVANRYREGPSSAVAADPHPCRGAAPAVQRTWIFDGTRLRGFKDGRRVDLAFPEIIDEHTMRVSHINLDFHIDGDTLRFIVPPLPRSCTGEDCLVQHAWAVAAFSLGPWTHATGG